MSADRLAQLVTQLASVLESPDRDTRLVDALRLVGAIGRLNVGVGIELAGRVEQLSSADREQPLARSLGERSAAVVVEVEAGIDAAEARRWCRVGAALRPETTLLGEMLPPRHAALADAFGAGALRLGAADLILMTLDEIEPLTSVGERAEVEAFLVDAAPQVTERQFAAVCRAIPARFQPEDPVRREELLRAKAGVRVRRTDEGLLQWIVTMHPEAEGFLTAAVDARTAPRREVGFRDADALALAEPEDRRPLPQRRLDALVALARQSLGSDTGTVAGTSVTMSVEVTLDDLRSGLGTARIVGVDEPISAATARRLAADAEIIPIVLGGPAQPLDVGRTERLATASQRRALEIRDGGCSWGTCTAPPGWCEVAHIVPWFDGGNTDLDNLMLLCAFHHRRFDLDGWTYEKRDGHRWFIPPAWVDASRTPRRAGPLPALPAA